MPFDVAAAKAAGYSDDEIAAYLGTPADTSGAPAPPSTSLMDKLPPAVVGVGALGAAGLGAAGVVRAARAAGPMASAAMEAGGHLPIIGPAIRGAQMLGKLGGGGAGRAAEKVSAPASTSISMSTAREAVAQQPARVTVSRARAKPKLSVVESPKPALGSSASRTATPQQAAAEVGIKAPDVTNDAYRAKTGAPVHEVQYYSESKAKFEPIEKMHISHIRNAMNKLYKKMTANNVPKPVTQKQFEAIKNEVTYRARQAGELTVPDAVGSAEARAAGEAAAGRTGLARAAGEAAAGRTGLAGLRAGVGGAIWPLEAVMYLLNASHFNEDMQDAHDQYMKQTYKEESTRRALEGPQGS